MGEPVNKEEPVNIEVEQEKFSVLIVEDEKGIAKLLTTAIGMVPDTSSVLTDNAEEAIRLARETKEKGHPFSLVLTDKGLDGAENNEDGYKVAQVVKDENLAHAVWMISGSAADIIQTHTPKQLEEMGLQRVIGKPFGIMAMVDSLKQEQAKRAQPQKPESQLVNV